jgi:tetratricopeptide (TPR) repeat protein
MKKRIKKSKQSSTTIHRKTRQQDTTLSIPSSSQRKKLKDKINELGYIFLGALILLGISPLIFYGQAGEFENVPKMAVIQWVVLFLVLIKVWQTKNEQLFRWNRSPMDVPLLLFYAFCWISLLQADNPYLFALNLLHLGACVIFFFLLLTLIKKESQIDLIIFTGTSSVAIVSLIGILQYHLNVTWIPQLASPASTFSNRNMAAQFVSLSLPLCLGSFLLARRWSSLLLSTLALVLTMTYLIYTQTRAGWIAAFVVLLIVIAITFVPRFSVVLRKNITKQKMLLGSTGLILIIILSGLSPIKTTVKSKQKVVKVTERFLSIGQVEKGTAGYRLIWWQNTLAMVKDNFWWGVGVGNFKIRYPLYHSAVGVDPTFNEEQQLNRVHNDHLQILAELGFLGFCCYAGIFLSFFYAFWKIYSSKSLQHHNEHIKISALFVCLGVVAFIVNAAFTFPMERAMPPFYLFTFFAVIGAIYANFESVRNISEEQTKKSLPAAVKSHWYLTIKILFSVLLVTFLFLSINFTRRIVNSDRYFVEAFSLGQKGDLERANEILKKAKFLAAWNYNITALIGRNYTMQGKYNQAIEEYNETLKAHPNNTNAVLNMGYCYLKLKKYDEAEKYFKRAIEIMPDFEQGHNNLGIIYYAKKEYEQAKTEYMRAIELDSNYAEPHLNLGNMYRTQGKINAAITEYEKAIEINPNLKSIREFLGNLYMKSGNYEKAEEIMEPLFKSKNVSAESYVLLGNLYQAQGKYKKSLEAYQRAQQLKPGNPSIYHNIGLSHYYLQNYAQSEEYLKKAISLNQNFAQAYNLLGQVMLKMKDNSNALAMFQQAVRINPKLRDARFNIATIYLRLGDKEESILAYKEALKIDPGFSIAHYNLASLLMEKGDKREAIFHFEEALKNPSKLINVEMTKDFLARLKKETQNESPIRSLED